MPNTKGSILLVEDEENIRDIVKLNLELEDYEVVTAKEGKTALINLAVSLGLTGFLIEALFVLTLVTNKLLFLSKISGKGFSIVFDIMLRGILLTSPGKIAKEVLLIIKIEKIKIQKIKNITFVGTIRPEPAYVHSYLLVYPSFTKDVGFT